MSLEVSFEVPEEMRIKFIDENILGKLPEETRDNTKSRVLRIIENYQGLDSAALSIMAYASERGRFDEFMERLETHYNENLQYLHPEARRLAIMPATRRAQIVFRECCEEMGVRPTN